MTGTVFRMCVYCRSKKDKSAFLRVARGSDKKAFVDTGGNSNGRGAYICPNAECIKAAEKRSLLSRSLGCPVPHEIYDELKSLATSASEQL